VSAKQQHKISEIHTSTKFKNLSYKCRMVD